MLETNELFRRESVNNPHLVQLSPEDIRNIQRLLLEQMEDFRQVCSRYGLIYVLTGGTALGAVRHQGFIPWDEDVDIGMPRADYEKIPEIYAREYKGKYWVQSIHTDPEYDLNFMKIRRQGTRYVEIFDTDPERTGLFIDIFCIENVYDFLPLRLLQGIMTDGLQLCASCVRIYIKRERLTGYLSGSSGGLLRAVRCKAFIGKLLSFRSLRAWCRSVEIWAGKCGKDQSEYVSIPAGRKHFFGETQRRETVFPPREGPFEGTGFSVMNDVHTYLRKLFGDDYMQLPPESERIRHSVIEYKYCKNK